MQKGRYEVLGTLGCGATSRVDKARDTLLGRTVALKTMVHSFGASLEQKQFLREAQIISQLSHPAIINLYDVGIEDESVAYLVMEFVPGKTLQQVLAESPIPLPRTCAWAADLAAALGRAHQAGILHGDVKPANILVTEDGNVKLGDFGIARFATQVSGSGRLMGTPAYLSPEQILGQPQNSRSDLFSLGIVLYQMITGLRPFDGSSVGAVCAQILSSEPVPPTRQNPSLPPAIDHIIMRCLAKNPADRYPSGEALAASLYPLARHVPIPEVRPNTSWLSRPIQPREVWAFAALVLAAAGVVPMSHAVARHFRTPPPPAMVSAPPKAPEDWQGYSIAKVELNSGISSDPAESAATPLPRVRARKANVAARRQPPTDVAPAPRDAHQDASPAAPALVAGLPAPGPKAVEHAALNIDIDATAAEGTLAIFADHELLLTTELHGDGADAPVHLQHALPVGPHQLQVALYRPDKSLQMEREGLGEIRGDIMNNLTIHVTRRSKLLLKHQTFLDVIWPSAMTPQTQAAKPAATGGSTAFLK